MLCCNNQCKTYSKRCCWLDLKGFMSLLAGLNFFTGSFFFSSKYRCLILQDFLFTRMSVLLPAFLTCIFFFLDVTPRFVFFRFLFRHLILQWGWGKKWATSSAILYVHDFPSGSGLWDMLAEGPNAFIFAKFFPAFQTKKSTPWVWFTVPICFSPSSLLRMQFSLLNILPLFHYLRVAEAWVHKFNTSYFSFFFAPIILSSKTIPHIPILQWFLYYYIGNKSPCLQTLPIHFNRGST